MPENEKVSIYDRIYDLVRQIPYGKVATYGQIAQAVGGCSARMVGYAMAALRSGSHPDVPWQRVINRQGHISLPASSGGGIQRQLLEGEGVIFDAQGRIDLFVYGWL